MNFTEDLEDLKDQRQSRRILAVCRVLDVNGKFLGFTLDLNSNGIKIIIHKDFPSAEEFEIILTQAKEDEEVSPDILVKIRQAWRTSTNDEFDQIGGVIIDVDSPSALDNLISYCDRKAKERYQLDW